MRLKLKFRTLHCWRGNLTDDMQSISTSYCASLIEKKVLESDELSCDFCCKVFEENDKLHAAYTTFVLAHKVCSVLHYGG